MINSSIIISGEASETDSDEDNHTVSDMTSSIQAAIITGEDSESDDDNPGSVSSAISVLTQSTKEFVHSDTSELPKSESLLHKKLRECNDQMCTDLNTFCQNIVNQAGKNLTAIDQQLLKSQNTLQTAVTSLRSLHVNSTMIKDRLQTVLSSKFLSNVK